MKATFGGGCFWCMDPPYRDIKGVSEVISGYTGGKTENPTYEEICGGRTGHAEAVQIEFDPTQTSYETLLDTFWHNIDPTALNRQFADSGTQYRTAIFYHDDEQKRLAEASKAKLAASGVFSQPLVTEIVPASVFYPAEDYHQNYACKNPFRYEMYKQGSGRGPFIEKTWGKPKKA